ncbi:hypothetical protein [Martelella sp. HB161492]|uniref:alginate O-acetyltransferase AlgX-related protein n=1 Tax=Martelella sp. HB161492 TaxID=2720726 RepID=UPI0015906384|nr:hypothetical protein [Martelella sp. HB161492]
MERRTMRKLALACLLLVTGIASADAEEATTSDYGCSSLETLASPKAVEGKDGFFFSVDDDIRMPLIGGQPMVSNIATLSRQLAARGTTLVYVPVPSKGQVMSAMLPDSAFALGFEADASRQLYDDFISQLRTADVTAVDLLTPLSAAGTEAPAFYRSAEYWSDHGARIAAKAVANAVMALPGYGAADHTTFETLMYGPVLRPSPMRKALQAFCVKNLPPVTGHVFQTRPVEGSTAGDQDAAPAALIGTQFSRPEFSPFTGFFEEFSALQTASYAVAGDDPLAAMIQYVKSQAFRSDPPAFLVWEAPVASARSGLQAIGWSILLAAAGSECQPLPAAGMPSGAPGLSVDMRKVANPGASVLMISTVDDTMSADAASQSMVDHIDLRTTDSKGKERHLRISADGQLAANGDFFVPLRPLSSEGLLDLSVVPDGKADAPLQLFLCTPPAVRTQ